MSKLKTSFSHGLLTIEFPAVGEAEKQGKAVQDQGKIVQRSKQEERKGPGPSNLGPKKLLDEEKQAGTSQEKIAPPTMNKEEPKTYKSAVEGKRAMPTSSREKAELKVKAGEAIPSLGEKERVKEEKLVERKEATQMGQQKTRQNLKEEEARSGLNPRVRAKEEKIVEKKEAAQTGHQKIGQKLKEEEAKSTATFGGTLKPKERVKEEVVERKEAAHIGQQKIGQRLKEEEAKSTPALGGSLKPKVHAKEEKVIERKKDADISQNKTGQKAKEKESGGSPPTIDASLEPKVHAKVVERKGDFKRGQKLKEEGKVNLGQKKQEIYTKPVDGDEARRTKKKIAPTNQAEPELITKEGDERTELNVVDTLRSNQDQRNEMVGVEEKMKQKKIEEAGLAKDAKDLKDNAEGPLLVEEGKKKKTDMDPPPAVGGRGMGEEESRTCDLSLANAGVAALVIMGFGAYAFVPLVKLFS